MSLQKSLIHLTTTSLSTEPTRLYACNSLFLLKNPSTFKRLLGPLFSISSVLFPAKHTGDRELNKSLIHQNNRGQVCLAMLAVVNRVVLAFFADILLDLVLL